MLRLGGVCCNACCGIQCDARLCYFLLFFKPAKIYGRPHSVSFDQPSWDQCTLIMVKEEIEVEEKEEEKKRIRTKTRRAKTREQ